MARRGVSATARRTAGVDDGESEAEVRQLGGVDRVVLRCTDESERRKKTRGEGLETSKCRFI